MSIDVCTTTAFPNSFQSNRHDCTRMFECTSDESHAVIITIHSIEVVVSICCIEITHNLENQMQLVIAALRILLHRIWNLNN